MSCSEDRNETVVCIDEGISEKKNLVRYSRYVAKKAIARAGNGVSEGGGIMKIEVDMEFERSTKGTHVYVEKKEPQYIGTLYVKKHSFGAGKPESIRLTVEW